MTVADSICALTGTGLSGLGLFALYTAWKGHAKKQMLSYVGWLALLLALIIWAFAGGKDRGVALGMSVISIQALLFVAYQAFIDKAPKKAPKSKRAKKLHPSEKASFVVLSKRIGTMLWVSVGCGALSFAAAIALHELLWQSGVHASNALVLALFIFPIIWAILSAFALTSQRRALKLGTYTLLGLSSTVILCLGNGVL